MGTVIFKLIFFIYWMLPWSGLPVWVKKGKLVPSLSIYIRGSFWFRNWTKVSLISCIGRQVLYHQRCLGSPIHKYIAQLLQLCLTLCNPMECNLPGSSVHGILHARILEWVSMSSSRGSSPPRVWIHVSCITGGFFTAGPLGKPIYIKIYWIIKQRRQWQPTPVLLPGKSHGRRRLVGYSPWGHKELDTTEWLHFHFSL